MTDYADLEKRLRQEGDDYESHYTTRELAKEAADVLASLTRKLEEAESDNKRLAESLGIDKQMVVDDLRAWPGRREGALPEDTLGSPYISQLMQQAADIITTGRSISRATSGQDDANGREG